MIWRTDLPILISAAAFAAVAVELWRFFRATHTAPLGVMRWIIVAVLSTTSLTQVAMLCGRWLSYPNISDTANLIESVCLAAMALLLWPFLTQVKPRLSKAMGQRVQRRVQRAETQLSQSKRWLELAEEISHVGHWTADVISQKIFWSDEIYRIHGLSKDSYVPEFNSVITVFHPDDRHIVHASIEKAVAEKSGYELRARLVRPGGEIRHVLSRGVTQLDANGEVISIFGVFLDLTEQLLIEEQLRQANLQAEQANEMLREMALVDSLTGLPNRRQFDAALDTEFKRAIRENLQLGVIMVDLDRFKGYNDAYGHPAGDECLRRVAKAIAGVLQRPGDLVARYGGEEMVVLLPNTDAAGVKIVAVHVKEAIFALQLEHRANTPVVVTISAGVAIFDPMQDSHTPLSLVQRADQALYQAKIGGRNRVVCEPPRQRAFEAYVSRTG